MWTYRRRVARDLERWRGQGWITPEHAHAISQDLAVRRAPFGTAAALAMLGVVLIGFATMSFVAANWQDMSRLTRLAILFAGMWGSYGAAGALAHRNMGLFANAAALLGVAIFGASIMLVAQMFHIEGNPPDAVLTWGAGSLLAGVALSSTGALGLSMLLAMLWGGWQQALTGEVFWPFLFGWAAVTAAYVRFKWRPGLHLAAIGASGFVIAMGYTLWAGDAHSVVALVGLCGVAAAILVRHLAPRRWEDESLVALGYALVVAFAGLFALQFFDETSVQRLLMLAVFTLSLLLAAIYWGIIQDHRAILWLGYGGFSAEVLGLYFETVGTLLGTSLFFLIAGVIVIVLAALAYRLHARADTYGGPQNVPA